MLSAHLFDLAHVFIKAWPTIWAFDTGRYLVAAGLMSAILWMFGSAGLAARKIQPRHAKLRDIRREVLASLRTAAVFSFIGFGIYSAVLRGWITVYTDFRQAGLGYFLATLVLMIVAHDAYFYWTHRLMHHPRLFRWFHATHHKSHAPTPWAAYAFAVPEALLQGAFTPLFIMLVPMHDLAIFTFMGFQIVRNVVKPVQPDVTDCSNPHKT